MALLLAEVEVLKTRCAALESRRAVSHIDQRDAFTAAAVVGTSTYTSNPIPELGVGRFNAYDVGNPNNFQIMDMATIPGMNMYPHLGPQPSPYDMSLPGNHNTSMLEAVVDADVHGYGFDFNPSTFSSNPWFDLPDPTVQEASFEAPILEGPPSTSDGSTSTLLPPSSIPSLRRTTHNCTQCMKSYSRLGDLRRHSLSHNPNAPRFSCPRAECGRQFLRMDKLKDHRARKHH